MKPLNCRLALVVASGLILIAASFISPTSLAQNVLPSSLTDAELWRIITEFSEADGPYQFENFISNEASINNVNPALKRLIKPGGVYLGVGPEQNFTYIATLQPKIAFVIDIRRQNMVELLMYQALFELSPTRADFVGRLFSRKRPANLDEKTGVAALFAAYDKAPPEDLVVNVQALRTTMAKHKYGLTSEDLLRIDFIYQVFARGGPGMTYAFASLRDPGGIPVTYAEMMMAKDSEGQTSSYLGSEEAYQYVRQMQQKNLIIPLVGDFAGPSTIRKIGQHLKDRNVTVSAFYVSNVETYLPGQKMKDFQANVATLPLDSSSLFIRWVPMPSISNLTWHTASMGPVDTGLASMTEFVDLIKAGRAPTTFGEAVRGTRDPATMVREIQDPLLRKVAGRITGAPALAANESLTIQLTQDPPGSGVIMQTGVTADGSFEFRNVPPGTFQLIALKTCKTCDRSTGLGISARVVIAERDVSGLQLNVPTGG